MTSTARKIRWIWLLLALGGIAFVAVGTIQRVAHIQWVTAQAGGSAVPVDPASPTGYAAGVRPLVPPERDARSAQWIIQTQEMRARGAWRVERADYDNAPAGRDVWLPSPYRWWLTGVSALEAQVSGRTRGAAIEQAALWADPLLHVLLCGLVAALLARWAGASAGALGALGAAWLFPLGAAFLPGRPDEFGWALVCAVLSVLPIVGSLVGAPGRGAKRRFASAGLAAGAGLWIAPAVHLPVLFGVVLGGAAWACVQARPVAPESQPNRDAPQVAWRVWGIAAAALVLVGWWIEGRWNTPGLLGPRWDAVQPLFALGCLGAGELLARLAAWGHRGRDAWTWPAILGASAGALALLALPVTYHLAGQSGFSQPGEWLGRMSDSPGELPADGLVAWFGIAGWSPVAVAALGPAVLALLASVFVLIHRPVDARGRGGVVFLLGPIGVAFALAWFRPADWTVLSGLLVVLVAPVAVALRSPGVSRAARGSLGAALAVVLLAGAWCVAPPAELRSQESVSRAEVQALIERDLAWWLASQAPEPGAIVLAPPEISVALIYHGGLRGLGTPYRENEDGFRYAVRLSAATTPDEGQALVESRGVRYLVLPSWDRFLDEYARLGANQPENTLIALLHRWQPPRWLRAVPYAMPAVAGFESESVAVFEVVDLQDNPTALSRLAEYFLETGRAPLAARLAAALEDLYPTEPAATVARAQVALARRDAGAFRELAASLLVMLDDGSAEVLTWDRRVSLALVLAQARHTERAREQAQRCLDEMDELALRSLTNRTLQRFLALLDGFRLEIRDPGLSRLATQLLPAEMRTPP